VSRNRSTTFIISASFCRVCGVQRKALVKNGETYKKALHNPKNQPSLHKFLSGNSSDSDGDEPDELDEIEPSTEATEANQHCDMADSDDEDMYAPVKCHARCKYSVQQQRHIDYVKKSIDDAGKCAFVL